MPDLSPDLDVWLERVLAERLSSSEQIYRLYSHDPAMADVVAREDPAARTQRYGDFVDGAIAALRRSRDRVAVENEVLEVRRRRWVLNIRPQDSFGIREAKQATNFLMVERIFTGRGNPGPGGRVTARVYARFDQPYDLSAINAFAVMTHDRYIWENMATFKIAAPGAMDRRDHFVAYVRNPLGVRQVRRLLEGGARSGLLTLHPGIPPGVRELSTGIGTAAHPRGNESFGTMLSRHIATAVERTEAERRNTKLAFRKNWLSILKRYTAEALEASGYDPMRPAAPPRRDRRRTARPTGPALRAETRWANARH